MADLAALLGNGGGFRPDARFASIAENEGDSLPAALGALKARFAGLHMPPPPAPDPAEPAPDPVALARAEAYAQGCEDTRAALEAEAAEAEALRSKLSHRFTRIDGELVEQFRQRLMDTVIALCEATLAPLTLDKAALAHRVERAAAMFARADDERVIRLHPDDLKLVRSLLPKDWAFTPDPALPRGTIRVESRQGGVEAGGVEDGPEQWRRAIAEALDLGGLD